MNVLKKCFALSGGIYLFTILVACKTLPQAQTNPTPALAIHPPVPTQDSIQLYIEPQNLSEDLSLFATKNDELLLLIYARKEQNSLPEMVFHQFFLADTSFQSAQFSLSSIDGSPTDTWTILLLEMDSNKSLEQIDPTIRLHFDEIQALSQQRDMPGLVRFLGKDDLLGMKEVQLGEMTQSEISFTIEGIHKMDKYVYLVRSKPF